MAPANAYTEANCMIHSRAHSLRLSCQHSGVLQPRGLQMQHVFVLAAHGDAVAGALERLHDPWCAEEGVLKLSKTCGPPSAWPVLRRLPWPRRYLATAIRGHEPGAPVLEPLHLTPAPGATTGRLSTFSSVFLCLSLSFCL